jgi:NADH-dependent peroxiredoxin subunit F
LAENIYETIIVGAGIAGCTAAIYAARKRMNYLIIADQFGGQFMESGEVLNYPGIKETTGVDFSSKMEEQLKFNKVKVQTDTLLQKIVKKNGDFLLKTSKGDYLTKTVLLATGSHPRKLNVPGEDKYQKMGVTYCAICDGPLFAKKDVAIIGGGDSAMEAVDFMDKIANQLYLIVRSDKLTAHEYLQESVNKNPKVKIIYNANTTEVFGDKFVTGMKYEVNKEVKELKVQGIFVEIGRVANTDFAKGLMEIDEHGHILVNCSTETSVPGIFAAGDCSSVHEYQYVISAGTACIALLKAAKYLARGGKK